MRKPVRQSPNEAGNDTLRNPLRVADFTRYSRRQSISEQFFHRLPSLHALYMYNACVDRKTKGDGMTALQVRDFPSDLYEELRMSAEQDHRSIAQQTIALLNQSLHASQAQPASAAASAHRMPPWVPRGESLMQQQERLNRRKAILSRLLGGSGTSPKEALDPMRAVQESRDERDSELNTNLPALG